MTQPTLSAVPPMIRRQDWWRLLLLSVLWGGSYFFVGIAVRDLPPLTIVLARVSLAAAILLPFLARDAVPGPAGLRGWWPFLVMALLNNVVPFSLIVSGQTLIASGLASVLNATTPLFTVLVMGLAGDEKLTANRIAGVLLGLCGVYVLRGPDLSGGDGQTLGIALCLAAASYGFAGLWGRRRLAGVRPLTAAARQLVCSAVVMLPLAAIVERPWELPAPAPVTWLALAGLAAMSTALAYVVFFRILASSGASSVMLVTLLIPVTAVGLGHLVLQEPIAPRELLGAAVIFSALFVVDGRIFHWFRQRG